MRRAAVGSTLGNKSLLSSKLEGRPYTQFNPCLIVGSKYVFPSHTTGSYWLWLGTWKISCSVITWVRIPRFIGEIFPCVTELANRDKEFNFLLPFIARDQDNPGPHLERGVPLPLTSNETGQFSINFHPRDTVCTEGPKISGLTKLFFFFLGYYTCTQMTREE